MATRPIKLTSALLMGLAIAGVLVLIAITLWITTKGATSGNWIDWLGKLIWNILPF